MNSRETQPGASVTRPQGLTFQIVSSGQVVQQVLTQVHVTYARKHQ